MLACIPRTQAVGANVAPEERIEGRANDSMSPPREAGVSGASGVAAAPSRGEGWLAPTTLSSYRAPAECPRESHFLEQLSARVTEPGLSEPRVVARPEVQVVIVTSARGEWTGRVLIESDGVEVRREVSGASCEEVVVALALITSFWLAPQSQGRRGESAEPAGSSPEREPATSAPANESRPLAPAPLDPSPSLEPEPAAPRPSHSEYGQHLVGHLGYVSSPVGAARVGVRWELWGSSSAESWAAAVSLSYARGQHGSPRLGASSLLSLLGQLDLCPSGLVVTRALWLRGCAQVRAGSLRFRPPQATLTEAQAAWRPWVAAGGGLHAGARLSSSVTLRVLSELSANLVRDEFDTERPVNGGSALQAVRLFRAGPVTLDVSAGVSYEF